MDYIWGMELIGVQYCRENAAFNKKDHKDQTRNAKVMRFQNFSKFAKNFTQFLGHGVCWGENYEEEKSFPKKFVSGEKCLGKFFYFSKISL